MAKITRLHLTPAVLARIEAVHEALESYHPGGESASVVEIPKLDLADAILEALEVQGAAAQHARRETWSKQKRVH